MSKEISIAISAKDNFTTVVSKMRDANIHFNKNLEEMQRQLTAINKNRATLKLDTKTAENNLKAIQKEYSKAKAAGDGMVSDELLNRLDKANEAYEQARLNLKEINKAANETERAMERAGGTFKKVENSIGGASGKDGILTAIAATGISNMISDTALNFAKANIASAYGDNGSTYFSSIISNLASGAAAGFTVGGAVGAGIGAGIGAGAGILNAGSQIQQQQDEYFKSYRDELVSDQTERIQNDISAGSGIAAQRELDKIAFDVLLKGDSTETLAGIRTMANSTPFLYEDLKGITKTLATYGYAPEDMQEKLTQIGDTGAALGMSTSDMGAVAEGLGRMKSSGKTTLEYLNLLIERGIPAIDYLAESMSVTNKDVYDMVSKGLIPGAQAAEVIANAMGEANSGAMDAMSKTFSGLTSTVQGLEQEMQNAYGEGYNAERSKGLKNQIDYLSSAEASETNRKIGAYYAKLENEKERLIREHEKAAYERIESENITDEAEMGRLLAKARTEAIAEYNATEGAKLEAESQRALIAEVGAALVSDRSYWEAGYLEGKERSKGMAAAFNEFWDNRLSKIKPNGSSAEYALNYEYDGVNTIRGSETYSDAYGMSYVPYDNFPANLHEGERVLTASEAREYQSSKGGVSINMYGMTVREEADIEKIAHEIARQIKLAQMIS